MNDGFFARNGWICKRYGDQVMAFCIRDKKFAFFATEGEFAEKGDAILTDVTVEPTPDFLAKPRFSAMTLTTQCNMNCPYCYVQPVYGKGEMTEDQARAAVNALSELTGDELVIYAWGGEPTQNPRALIAMIEEAAKHDNIKILLITNGVMEEKLLEQLLSYKNLVFQLSFDGKANENLQKPLKGKEDSLDTVLTSFETICRVSRRVALRSTITSQNAADIRSSLIETAAPHTNRIMIEHIHTSSGRSVHLKHLEPDVQEYVDLVFDLVPKAEETGVHVKVLPLDQIREGGPNDNMTFLNVLTDGSVVVSNAVIHHTHKDFEALKIGRVRDGRILFDRSVNPVLAGRYLKHYHAECAGCDVAPLCRGSVQRYLFITHDQLGEWDDKRCQYYKGVIHRWMDVMYDAVREYLQAECPESGYIELIPPEGKKHYPVFVMKGGFQLSYKAF